MFLYNTFTGAKEEFKPIKAGMVGMYNCGPTVYNFAHIGNLRAYVFADVLRRTLEYNGYKVRQVMNVTDIGHLTSDADEGDDKMVTALRREGKSMTMKGLKEVADKYTGEFMKDLGRLNIELPHEMPKASEHIKEDIEIIDKLEEKDIAYKTGDGIFFDTAKFSGYGKLGNININGQRAGARVELNAEKRNPTDFALWKSSKGDIGWESPWGRGFPGWHIECSAMSRKYLGQPFDIHTGGIDHIPVHHNNEIAQSESAYGTPLSHYWMHNEFMNINDRKMAKSGDNFITLQTLISKGFHPLAYRYFLLTAHYRSHINFSFDALSAAQNSYLKLLHAFDRLNGKASTDQTYKRRFEESVDDDLHTPTAIATLWDLLRDEAIPQADKRATILDFDSVLGLDIENQSLLLKKEMESVPDDINALAHKREEARKSKNFKEADMLRDRIEEAGFEIMDADSGHIIRKKLPS